MPSEQSMHRAARGVAVQVRFDSEGPAGDFGSMFRYG